jgi:uncharacterized protein (TIGR02466 family)
MKYIDIFPTTIRISVESELKETILPIAEEYISKYGKPFRFNSTNYISTYDVGSSFTAQRSDDRLNPLNNYIRNASKQYFEDISIDFSSHPFNLYYLFNKILKDGNHSLHSHPNNLLSGVFYLKIPENSSPIIFNDPRDYYKYIQYPVKFGNPREMYKLFPEYVINPVEGMIIIWPSWLEHQVPASLINNERIAVAFNIF